ncbi:unnamed protein product [Ceutorhynchus assimilis]|uniref:Uncharacterized protein n=1 Tax=Ceutorhynchus assimilis TaxID=467358 RepID=A0A9N9MK06_9CUCU|nr:unnamed protein product [Ceutorhynchus assimilis]
MSFEYYTNWWIQSKKNLEELNNKDEGIRAKFKPITDRNLANQLIGGLYTHYSLLVQDLSACVDQMAQAQKRFSAKKLLDSACIRLNEFNDELRKISLSEYHYIDDTLVELKLIPYNVEILHPSLFHHRPVDIEDMISRIKQGESIYVPPVLTVVYSDTDLLEQDKDEPAKLKNVKSVAFSSKTELPAPDVKRISLGEGGEGDASTQKSTAYAIRLSRDVLTLPGIDLEQLKIKRQQTSFIDALLCIQIAERARQERLYFHDKNIIYQRSKALRDIKLKGKPLKPAAADVANLAAAKIQKVFRGYKDRETLKAREQQRRLLIGIYLIV